jgi:hypothetical protein
MNKKIKKLLNKAGFIFWGEEPWKPAGAVIDWSCEYDRDMELFVKLLVEDIATHFAYTVDDREQMLKRYLDN